MREKNFIDRLMGLWLYLILLLVPLSFASLVFYCAKKILNHFVETNNELFSAILLIVFIVYGIICIWHIIKKKYKGFSLSWSLFVSSLPIWIIGLIFNNSEICMPFLFFILFCLTVNAILYSRELVSLEQAERIAISEAKVINSNNKLLAKLLRSRFLRFEVTEEDENLINQHEQTIRSVFNETASHLYLPEHSYGEIKKYSKAVPATHDISFYFEDYDE